MLQPPGRGPLREPSVVLPWDRTTAAESAGLRDMPFVPKENVRGFGWGRGKGYMRGAWGGRMRSKQTDIYQMTFSATGEMVDYVMRELYLAYTAG